MFIGLLSFGGSLAMKCVSMSNQPCQPRPIAVDIYSNAPVYYPFTVNVNKCARSCNTIDGLYAQIFVPNKVKNMNVKLFNLMLRVNEARFLVQNESCKC